MHVDLSVMHLMPQLQHSSSGSGSILQYYVVLGVAEKAKRGCCSWGWPVPSLPLVELSRRCVWRWLQSKQHWLPVYAGETHMRASGQYSWGGGVDVSTAKVLGIVM
jgi:hypothetical protein